MSMYAIHIDRLDYDPEKLSFHLDLVDNEDKYDLTSRIATGRDIITITETTAISLMRMTGRASKKELINSRRIRRSIPRLSKRARFL